MTVRRSDPRAPAEALSGPLVGFGPRLGHGLFAAALSLAASVATAGSVELPLSVGGAYHVPVTSLRERRDATTVRQRYDHSCGSAALSTLLTHHYGQPVSEDAIFEEMLAHGDAVRIGREGFSLLDMKHYLEAHGYAADGYEEPVERLAEAGIPAIALLVDEGYHHFVVIKGVRDGRVLVGDPARGARTIGVAAFRAALVNRILFVIGNRRDAAVFNAAADWQRAPVAPLAAAVGRDGLAGLVVPKFGPADF